MTASTDTHTASETTIADDGCSPTIKAILFDLDGTLLDTETLSDKAVLLATFGGAIPPHILAQSPMSNYSIPWELKKQLLGLRGAEWAPIVIDYAQRHWQPSKGNPIRFPDAMQLWKAWEDHLSDMCEQVDACPGAKEVVQAFANSPQQLPMAIATSSRYAGVDKKRKRHEEGMFEHFQAIVAGDDPAVKNGKPAPDIYLQAAKRLQVRPEECLVFEDALSGVKAGKAAGCRVVAIPDPRYTETERAVFETEGCADVILNSLWEFDGRPFGLDVNLSSLRGTTTF
ncbi:HAD family hydrolase [Nitzschia inconspicua]|uniref:HAD family hydrolase n=1 Tax=Nitzschia inconspicua TaxID=303405 RepID=A0A9K3Q6P0_9STRA|nr:HAD family hydrolase [Nitzschia inconspicua]